MSNDIENLTEENRTLRVENVKMFTTSEQLENSILELRNEKELPKA